MKLVVLEDVIRKSSFLNILIGLNVTGDLKKSFRLSKNNLHI